MLDLDPSVQKSLDRYVKQRILEIPGEIRQAFPSAETIWKCHDEDDFLYGYYVGRIEEGSLHYLLKATRASAGGYADMFEIRGVIEAHKGELRAAIQRGLS